MASRMSMSESMQVSAAFQHQVQQTKQGQPAKQVNLCYQILMVGSLVGLEMCMGFEQIYQVLILQFLGVPLSLVSMSGIMGGTLSIILLPALAYVINTGPNPRKRKMAAIFLSMCFFVVGLIFLIACGCIKVNLLNIILQLLNTTGAENITKVSVDNELATSTLPSISLLNTSVSSLDIVTDVMNPTTPLPFVVAMSIIGFASLDIGYDASMSLTRAFVLDCVPSTQHTQILVVATVAQSGAGMVFCALGIIDWPSILEPVFNADGTALMLIFLCVLLLVLVILSTTATLLTGYFCGKRSAPDFPELKRNLGQSVIPKSNAEILKESSQSRKARLAKQQYVSDILHTEEGLTATQPLLFEDSLKINYKATSATNADFSVSFSSLAMGGMTDTWNRQEEDIDQINQSPLAGTNPLDNTNSYASVHTEMDYDEETSSIVDVSNKFQDEGKLGDRCGKHLITKAVPGNSGVFGHSKSTSFPTLGDFHNRKLAEAEVQEKIKGKKDNQKTNIFADKRLKVLWLSSFFSMGALLGYIGYAANAYTIGILHGDPMSLPGTEGRARYEEGLRTSALGNLINYITYFSASMFNKKIINLIGEKVEFTLGFVFFGAFTSVLILVQSIDVFFVAMVFTGLLRSSIFTVPFVLATKFTQENKKNEPSNQSATTSQENLGKVITAIGYAMPCHYMIVSCLSGPVMDATGNVWVPLVYSVCSSVAAVTFFSSLFFMK